MHNVFAAFNRGFLRGERANSESSSEISPTIGLDSLLVWARDEARKADDEAHDTSTGMTVRADAQRSLAWGRAAAFYEMIERLEG